MERDYSVDVDAFDPAIGNVLDAVSTKFDAFCKARGISPSNISEEYDTLEECEYSLSAGHKVYWGSNETGAYAIVNYFFNSGLEEYHVGTGCIVMRDTPVSQRECVLIFHADCMPERRAVSQVGFHPFRQYNKYHMTHITLKWDARDPKSWNRAVNNISKLLDPIIRAMWQTKLFTDIQMASPIREQLFQEKRGNKTTYGIEHRTKMHVDTLELAYDNTQLQDYALGIVDNPLDAMDTTKIDKIRADRLLILDMEDWSESDARKLFVQTTKQGTYVWRVYKPYARTGTIRTNFVRQTRDFFRSLGKANDQNEVNTFVREHCNPLAVSDPVAYKFESKEKLGEHRPDWFQKMCTLDVICDGENPTIFVENVGGCLAFDSDGKQLYVLDLGEPDKL